MSVYSFRLRPSENDKVRELLSANQIAIGWSHARGLMDPKLTYDEFRAVLDHDYPTLRTERRLGRDTTHLWRFIRKLEIGDIVVVPHGDDIYFVRVSSDAFYLTSMVNDDTAIRRNVVPLLDGRPVKRWTLKPELRDSLAFRTTSRDLAAMKNAVLELVAEKASLGIALRDFTALVAADQNKALLLEESIGVSHRSELAATLIDRRHAEIWHLLVAHLMARGLTVSNQRVGALGPDLFTVGQPLDFLFEIKTGVGSSDFLKGVGQLLVYEKALGRPFKKFLVLPGNPTGVIRSILTELDIDVISYDSDKAGSVDFTWPTASA